LARIVSNSRVCIKQQDTFSKKVSLFIENYGRELRMGTNIRKKEKIEKATEFAERIKKV